MLVTQEAPLRIKHSQLRRELGSTCTPDAGYPAVTFHLCPARQHPLFCGPPT
jgi:hypothetical protein